LTVEPRCGPTDYPVPGGDGVIDPLHEALRSFAPESHEALGLAGAGEHGAPEFSFEVEAFAALRDDADGHVDELAVEIANDQTTLAGHRRMHGVGQGTDILIGDSPVGGFTLLSRVPCGGGCQGLGQGWNHRISLHENRLRSTKSPAWRLRVGKPYKVMK